MRQPEVLREQMIALDRWAIEVIGIPGVVLMENAGAGAAAWARTRFEIGPGRRVCCVAGPGNNGGDAFVVARHLRNAGVDVSVLTVGAPAPGTPDALVNFTILERLGVPIEREPEPTAIARASGDADLVIDGLLGTGLRGAPRAPYHGAIEAINGGATPVLALDIPSGLDANTGEVPGECIRAHATATFAHPKAGFSRARGPDVVGELRVIDIAIPYEGPGRPPTLGTLE